MNTLQVTEGARRHHCGHSLRKPTYHFLPLSFPSPSSHGFPKSRSLRLPLLLLLAQFIFSGRVRFEWYFLLPSRALFGLEGGWGKYKYDVHNAMGRWVSKKQDRVLRMLLFLWGLSKWGKTVISHMNGPRRLGPSRCRKPLLRSLTEGGRRMNVGQRGKCGRGERRIWHSSFFIAPPGGNTYMTSAFVC